MLDKRKHLADDAPKLVANLTNGLCDYCGEHVGADSIAVTNGGPWVAFCSEQHYHAKRGTPILTIELKGRPDA